MTEGHRTLGICLDPTISFKSEVEYLTQVSNQLTGRLRRSSLTKSEVRTAYRSMYLPKMCYGASVTSFTEEQSWAVERNAVRAFLSALGYNPNMPRLLVFAPDDLGGVGLTTIKTEQGVDHVKALIRHIRADATVGHLMQILMRTSQLISGRSTDIFLHPDIDLRYIAEFKQKWICKIRNTLASAKAQVHLTDH